MSGTGQTFFDIPQGTEALDIMSFPGMESAGSVPGTFDLDSSWMSAPNNMDWVRIIPLMVAHRSSTRLTVAAAISRHFSRAQPQRPRQYKRARPGLDGEGTADERHDLGYSP